MRKGSCGTVIGVLQSTRNSVEKTEEKLKSTLLFDVIVQRTETAQLPQRPLFSRFEDLIWFLIQERAVHLVTSHLSV